MFERDPIEDERSRVRDLLSVMSLPTLWQSFEPETIADSALQTVVSALRLEAASVSIEGYERRFPPDVDPQALSDHAAGQPSPLPPALRALALHLPGGPRAVLASAEPSFPRDYDRSLARTALEQAALSIRAVRERKLALALADAESALREESRRKDEFFAILGHELRNPLAPICLATESLRRSGVADLAAREVEIIERHTRHLVRLVDDLLDVARAVKGRMRVERGPVDLADVVRTALEMADPLIRARKHQVQAILPEGGLVVEGDRGRLVQAVSALVINAAKYTDEGGRIDLEAGFEGGAAVLRVRDDGVGMPPEMLRWLFEPFVQAERSVARSEGGLGLGLTLARSIVELHGGAIEARSEGAGRGSEFTIYLPASAGIGPAPAPPEDAPLAPALRRVLVVDDNEDAAELLALALEHAGHAVRAVYTGSAAVEAARAFRPDAAVLDIALPDFDGVDLGVRLRESLPELRLIALSGYGEQRDRDRSAAAGFVRHLIKPVDFDALFAALA